MTHPGIRGLIVAAVLPALALACSQSAPDDVTSVTGAQVISRSVEVTVTSVTRGDNPPESPNRVGIAFPGFTVPPSAVGRPYFTTPSSVDLGTCQDDVSNPNQTCSGLVMAPDPWKMSYTFDTTKPKTVTVTGQVIIAPQGFGAPVFFRCFHVGLDTATNTLHSLPVSRTNCSGQGPDDAHDPVTCSGSTCTAKVSVGSAGDGVPWRVKMSFNVPSAAPMTFPYVVQTILYAPPFNHSSTNYGTTSSLTTTTSWSSTLGSSFGVNGGGSDTVGDATVMGSGGTTFTTSTTSGGSTVTQSSSMSGDGIRRSDSYCADPNNVCDPSLDPNHDLDTFIILFAIPGRYDDNLLAMGHPKLTLDYSNGSPRRMTVAELKGLARTPQDFSGFCTSQGCDLDRQFFAQTYLKVSDAQQILAADPYVSGVTLSQHPERFEPACRTAGTCATPETIFVDAANSAGDFIAMESHAQGNGSSFINQNLMTGLRMDFGVKVDGLGLSFGVSEQFNDTTTIANMTTKTAAVTFDNSSHCEKGTVELWLDKAFGSLLFVPHLLNSCTTCMAGQQLCTLGTGSLQCTVTRWGFELSEPIVWGNSAETSSQLSTTLPHTGNQSLMVSPSSDPTLPASVNNLPCTGADVGTMDVRGKTFSAWIYVPTSSSSYANTSCRLRALNRNFQQTQLTGTATQAPIVPGGWFLLSGRFPATALESQIYELAIDCTLPADWAIDDPSKTWFVDDVQVN